MKNEKITKDFPNDSATQEWLNTQKSGTRAAYKMAWRRFLTYTGLTGDAILADRRNDKDFHWEAKVLASKRWTSEKGFSDNTAKVVATSARSFFSYHRVPLQFRKGEKARISEGHAESEDYRFSVDDLKRMHDIADLKEKYIIVAGKSFGLRAGDFMRLTRGDLQPYIDREVPISIGRYNTEKEGVYAYPFIDTDAQPIIKLMLENMSREGRTNPNDKILTYKDSCHLSRVLKRLAEKASINVGNKTVRFHCMRKFLIDHLASFMSTEKFKQIVGKTITEGAYVSPDSLREDYARAMAHTCFSKQIGSQDMEKIAKKQALLMLAKSMGMEEEQVTTLFAKRFSTIRGKRITTIDYEIEALEQAIKEKREPKASEPCKDGEHCQRVASEAELPDLLAQGWHASIVLPSGKIVITH
jgi:integrase